MSGVTVAWLFVASACLTLSAIRFLIGLRRPRQVHHSFALMAASAAGVGACELAVMRSETAARALDLGLPTPAEARGMRSR